MSHNKRHSPNPYGLADYSLNGLAYRLDPSTARNLARAEESFSKTALKGPYMTAQGNAPGKASLSGSCPERAPHDNPGQCPGLRSNAPGNLRIIARMAGHFTSLLGTRVGHFSIEGGQNLTLTLAAPESGSTAQVNEKAPFSDIFRIPPDEADLAFDGATPVETVLVDPARTEVGRATIKAALAPRLKPSFYSSSPLTSLLRGQLSRCQDRISLRGRSAPADGCLNQG